MANICSWKTPHTPDSRVGKPRTATARTAHMRIMSMSILVCQGCSSTMYLGQQKTNGTQWAVKKCPCAIAQCVLKTPNKKNGGCAPKGPKISNIGRYHPRAQIRRNLDLLRAGGAVSPCASVRKMQVSPLQKQPQHPPGSVVYRRGRACTANHPTPPTPTPPTGTPIGPTGTPPPQPPNTTTPTAQANRPTTTGQPPTAPHHPRPDLAVVGLARVARCVAGPPVIPLWGVPVQYTRPTVGRGWCWCGGWCGAGVGVLVVRTVGRGCARLGVGAHPPQPPHGSAACGSWCWCWGWRTHHTSTGTPAHPPQPPAKRATTRSPRPKTGVPYCGACGGPVAAFGRYPMPYPYPPSQKLSS